MSTKLELAFAEAAKLPESDQESLAEFILAELRDESEWKSRFSSRPDVLEKLANRARKDHADGKTLPIEDLFK